MKSQSRFRSFIAIIALASAAAFTACSQGITEAGYKIARLCREVRDWAEQFIRGAVASFARTVAQRLPGLTAVIIAARHYLLRQVKRERPRRHAGWGFATST